ncbi:hypothetical protein BQ8794_200168 [Mesorhizobium prunaredense]|uniref:Uncharacterized protein n=1 Tax=Mesorhizobium prunaredense TaxID=1631249 RepID=A0A1R3V5I4_9HYPH|nr:hypothetical protein BQ8794_200168 [Mesorhizobium prunaredense]
MEPPESVRDAACGGDLRSRASGADHAAPDGRLRARREARERRRSQRGVLTRLATFAAGDRPVHGVDPAAGLFDLALGLGAGVRRERAEAHTRIGEGRLGVLRKTMSLRQRVALRQQLIARHAVILQRGLDIRVLSLGNRGADATGHCQAR